MKNAFTNLVNFIMVMSLFSICMRAYAVDSAVKQEHIKSVTAITEVFADGQKVTAVAIEYDKDIDNSKLLKTTFSVNGRTITKVYANNAAAKAAQGINGKYVIIELSLDDKGASILVQNGRTVTRSEVKVSVAQTGDITTTDGEKYASNTDAMTNSKVVNLVVDDFKQLEYKDPKTGKTLKYNLFIPQNYDKKKSYPLIMFIHDAGVTSTETDMTLIQGLGGVIWATPSEQAKHECFVLAPQYESAIVNDNSETTEDVDITVNLINYIDDIRLVTSQC